MSGQRSHTLVMLHLAVLLAGWTGVFGRLISLDGLPLVWYRVMVSVPCMVAVLAVSGRLKKVPVSQLWPILGCGVLLAIHWTSFYESIKSSNVSVGVACIATSCFFTTLFNPIFGARKFSVKEVLLSFIAIAGILLIFSIDIRYRTGILWGLFSAAVYSLFAIFNIRTGKLTGQDSATMLMWELAGSLIILSVCVPLLSLLRQTSIPTPQGMDIWWLIILGSVLTIIPFLFQIIALRRLSAFTVNVTYNLEPVYSIIFAAVLFDEAREVGWSFWLGMALVIFSVIAVARSGRYSS